MMAFGAAQAQQLTPQALINEVPSLPTPQDWAVNKGQHSEAFMAKIETLKGRLGELQPAPPPAATQADYEQQQANMQRQQQEAQQNAQAAGEAMAAMGLTAEDMKKMQNMSEKEMEAFLMQRMQGMPQVQEAQKQMEVLASMGITEADMRKMEKMNSKQSEAYMKKRLAENGYTEADVKKRMEQAGVSMMADADWEEQARRDDDALARATAREKAQATLDAWMVKYREVNRLLQQEEERVMAKLKPIEDKYKPEIERYRSILASRTGLYMPQPGDEPDEVVDRKRNTAVREYREQAFAVWRDYVHACQAHLKATLPDAQAADEAERAKAAADATGNAAIDQWQGSSNNVGEVLRQYLSITAGEPELDIIN